MHQTYDNPDEARHAAHILASMTRLYVVLRTQTGEYEVTTKTDAEHRRLTQHVIYITDGTGAV